MRCKVYYWDGSYFEGEWFQALHLKDFSKIIHREDGPAIENINGTKEWFLNGNLHREGGPAVEWHMGDREWWVNNNRHREDGPAIECASGSKYWYQNGVLHREDGPAIEIDTGARAWYLNGKYLETLTKKYLIRYMELTGETLTTLLLHPDYIIRDSVKKYKWSKRK